MKTFYSCWNYFDTIKAVKQSNIDPERLKGIVQVSLLSMIVNTKVLARGNSGIDDRSFYLETNQK